MIPAEARTSDARTPQGDRALKPGAKSKFTLVLAILVAALAPAGCGRKGGLEPPGAAPPPPMAPATVIGGVAGPTAEPAETPPPKRPFFLDVLI